MTDYLMCLKSYHTYEGESIAKWWGSALTQPGGQAKAKET